MSDQEDTVTEKIASAGWTPPSKHILLRARDFYAIYCASSGGRTWDGRECPTWKKLGDAVQRHWYTVAARAVQLQLSDPDADRLGEEKGVLPNTTAIGHLGGDSEIEAALVTWTEYSAENTVPLMPSEIKIMKGNAREGR